MRRYPGRPGTKSCSSYRTWSASMSEPDAVATPYRTNRPALSGPLSRGSSTWYSPALIGLGASHPTGTTVLKPSGPKTFRYPGGSGLGPEAVGVGVLGVGLGEGVLGGPGV